MPRQPRVFIPGLPLHIVTRGHSKQRIFHCDRDREVFLEKMKAAMKKYGVSVHCWAMMNNHVHVLATPENEDSLACGMQRLGSTYARYFNSRYGRSGALWESRYKPSHVDTDQYLLACHRYIELNPVRAGIVASPEQYRWSSHRSNAWGIDDGLTTPHPVLLAMSNDNERRLEQYRAMFHDGVDEEMLAQFRHATATRSPVGSPDFIERMARLMDKNPGGE